MTEITPTIIKNHVYGQNPSINVGVELHPQSKEALTPAAEALVEALEAIEIEATITYFNTSSQNSDAVHVLVGPKR